MQIDWLTVAAQIVNFLILVWLLQRFLFAPVTRAMARREDRIAERLSDARAAREEARAEARELRRRQEELDARKEAVLDAARDDAAELRRRLEAEIRDRVAEAHRDWRDEFERERAERMHDLRVQVAGHAMEVARLTLAELAGAELETEVAGRFAAHLADMTPQQRERLAAAAGRTGSAAVIESGFALPAPVRGRITRALHEAIGKTIEVEYRTDETLLLGLRLTVGDQAAEWSAGAYLDRLETLVDEALEAELHGGTEETRGGEPDHG